MTPVSGDSHIFGVQGNLPRPQVEPGAPPGIEGCTSEVDRILSLYPGRGIDHFFVEGGADRAAEALQFADRVMIVTGFNVEEGMPETDGPPGAAILANALARLGKQVTIVTDSTNNPIMNAAYRELDPKQENVRIARFDVCRRDPTIDEQAHRIIDEHRPNVVISIELPSRTAHGDPKNMRGKDIGAFNPALDGIMIAARNSCNVDTTIGIGDGGNEAGMGRLRDKIPTALDGSDMAAAVAADVEVTAFNSNLGAQAVAALLLQLAGRIDELPTGEQLTAITKACMDAGAVDGVTRGRNLGEAVLDDQGMVKAVTGVDGMPTSIHAGLLDMLKVAARAQVEPRLYHLAIFDSSNGGEVAARSLMEYLPTVFGQMVRLIAALDHGNAPYGTKTREDLAALVHNALVTLARLKPDAIAMACNTACTVLAVVANKLGIPVIDLIDVTAKAMLKMGGKNPVVLATNGTVQSNIFGDRVSQYSEGAIDPVQIACHTWADQVNHLLHLSEDEGDKATMMASVREYVGQIPEDATSVWLCCTHYPALEKLIRQALDERGMAHVPVVNPMAYQAAAAADVLEKADTSPQANRKRELTPIVLTTGNRNEVQRSLTPLMGREGHVHQMHDFGELDLSAEVELILEELFKDTDAAKEHLALV